MELTYLCMGCMSDKGEHFVCPSCRHNEDEGSSPLALAPRTILNQQYLIGRVLGSPGGFGITYLAWDIRLERKVAIKEYLPREWASRDANHSTVVPHSREAGEYFRFGLDQFLTEARLLAKFDDHPNVVRVRTFFTENETGYMVMDYYQGMTLAEYLAQQGGKLPPETVLAIMLPLLSGLREVHEHGVLHRDIKPQNIYLTEQGRPLLLDFGAARVAVRERTQSLSVVLTEGFAPHEQYDSHGKQGPWTDIYACAATLYMMLTGSMPPPGWKRVGRDELVPLDLLVPGVPPGLRAGVMQALSVEPERRPQNVRAFQALLAGETQPLSAPSPFSPSIPVSLTPTGEASSTQAHVATPTITAPANSGRSWQYVAVGAISLLILVLAWQWAFSGRTERHIESHLASAPTARPSEKRGDSTSSEALHSAIAKLSTPDLDLHPLQAEAKPQEASQDAKTADGVNEGQHATSAQQSVQQSTITGEAKIEKTEPTGATTEQNAIAATTVKIEEKGQTPPPPQEHFRDMASSRYQTVRATSVLSEPRKGATVLHRFAKSGGKVTAVAMSQNYVKVMSPGKPTGYVLRKDLIPEREEVASQEPDSPTVPHYEVNQANGPASYQRSYLQSQQNPAQAPTQEPDRPLQEMKKTVRDVEDISNSFRRMIGQ
jgi:serine/threonine protein kinase